MKHFLPVFLIALLFACDNKQEAKQATSEELKSFEEFKSEFISALWQQNPIRASYEGFHKYDDRLPISNEEQKAASIEFMNTWLSQLEKYDYSSLIAQDQIDFHLIQDHLNSIDFFINKFKQNEWDPSSYNLGGAFFQVINYQGESLENRLTTLSKKLEPIRAYYDQAKKNIVKPTEVHTKLAIQQLEGSKSVFKTTLLDSLAASTLDETFKNSFTQKVTEAIAAIEDYKTYLEDNFAPHFGDTTGTYFKSFRIGEKLFEEKFNYQIQSAYNAKEIFEAAVSEKESLHNHLFRLSEMLWEDYFGEKEKPGGRFEQIQMVIDAVADKHVHRDSFVTAIRQQIPVLEAFVRENDLISLDPNKPLVVRETPEYMRGFAGASISAPGPYDAEAETYYNVTPLDHYTEEEAESYLREYNDFTLQILNIHEAIPGHYTQLVYSNQSPSLIKSVLGNGAMIEGWAVYTEKMMLENGYGGDFLEMGLMYYKWNLRTVCNTILDYGIQVHGFTEEDAMQLLMKEAFQEKSEAEGKWRRARLSQVQLCSYFTGYYEIMQLRDEMMELQGEAFDLKEFHEEFLSYGSAPVKYIRKLMVNKHTPEKVES